MSCNLPLLFGVYMKIFKKIFVSFLIVFLCISPAYAFVPLALLASAVNGATSTEVALTASVLFHGAIAAIVFKNSPTDLTPAMVVNLAPKGKVVSGVPAGWAAGATQYDYPVPPPILVSAQTTTYSSCNGGGYPDATSAENSCFNFVRTTYPSYNVYRSGDYLCNPAYDSNHAAGYPCGYYTALPSMPLVIKASSTQGCPTGYTVSGSNCNLSNANTVVLPTDNTKYVPRVGNALTPSARDTDLAPTGIVFTNANTITATDSVTGEKTVIALDSATGVGTIAHTYSNSSGGTTTDTFTTSNPAATDSTVTVSGVASSTVSGQGTSADTLPTVSGTSEPATGNDIANGSNAIIKKLDQAQQAATANGEANAKKVTDKLHEELKGPLSAPGIDANLDGLNDAITTASNTAPDVNTSWLPSLFPGAATACIPFPINMSWSTGLLSGIAGSAEIDICDKLDLARQILGWLLGVVTVFYVFRVFARVNRGA